MRTCSLIRGDKIYKDSIICDDSGAPVGYELAPGESVVLEFSPAFRFDASCVGVIKPRWNGSGWEEAATAEEIKTWEAEHPAPVIPDDGPSLEDRVTALEEQNTTWNAEAESAYQKGVQKA